MLSSMFSVVVVHDLNLGWTELCPDKAHPVLIVDPNAILPAAITLQSL